MLISSYFYLMDKVMWYFSFSKTTHSSCFANIISCQWLFKKAWRSIWVSFPHICFCASLYQCVCAYVHAAGPPVLNFPTGSCCLPGSWRHITVIEADFFCRMLNQVCVLEMPQLFISSTSVIKTLPLCIRSSNLMLLLLLLQVNWVTF